MNRVIVVDTNIIVSLLISNNQKTRQVFSKHDLSFVAPKFIIVELFKHAPRIQNASNLAESEVLEVLSTFTNYLKFYNEDSITVGSWIEAYRLCRGIDLKDSPYIALTLELGGELWTTDESLKIGLRGRGFNDFFAPKL